MCLERIPYILVSQEICSSNTKTLGLYLNERLIKLNKLFIIKVEKYIVALPYLASEGTLGLYFLDKENIYRMKQMHNKDVQW